MIMRKEFNKCILFVSTGYKLCYLIFFPFLLQKLLFLPNCFSFWHIFVFELILNFEKFLYVNEAEIVPRRINIHNSTMEQKKKRKNIFFKQSRWSETQPFGTGPSEKTFLVFKLYLFFWGVHVHSVIYSWDP